MNILRCLYRGHSLCRVMQVISFSFFSCKTVWVSEIRTEGITYLSMTWQNRAFSSRASGMYLDITHIPKLKVLIRN